MWFLVNATLNNIKELSKFKIQSKCCGSKKPAATKSFKNCKIKNTTQDLGSGENPNINEILDYKTPPLTIKGILLLLNIDYKL